MEYLVRDLVASSRHRPKSLHDDELESFLDTQLLSFPNPIPGHKAQCPACPLQDSTGAKRFMSELMNTLAGASFGSASTVEGT